MKERPEEIGDLFVTESSVTLKLMPSKKSGSKTIDWFANGSVVDRRSAAKDIGDLVEKIKGKSRVVRRLTVMTDKGAACDLSENGLEDAVQKAGFSILN